MDGTVLIADDDRTIRTVLTQAMTRAGAKVHATSSLTTLMRWVEEGKGDLVVSDVVMPDGNGIEMMPRIAELRPDLPVIVISAQNTIMTAVRAAEAEAFDYLPKPFDLPDLMKRVRVALERSPGRSRPDPGSVPPPAMPLIGRSDSMQELYRVIARVMNSTLPILISGESGSGKSLIARSIHDLSDRSEEPFEVVDEEKLIGLSGAEELSQLAGRGTILFDDIGDFSPAAQLRLTRFIDRLDDKAPRLLSATRSKLSERVVDGSFREDVFYRLAGVTLNVPPLRDRVEDIPLLVAAFLARGGAQNAVLRCSEATMTMLSTYSWPGNVRQLEMVIAQLTMTVAGDEIQESDVISLLGNDPVPEGQAKVSRDEGLSESIAHHLRRYFDLHGNQLPPTGLYGRILHEMELPLLKIALDATGGNQAKAAELLGINRNTLRKKLTDLDIRVTRRRKLM